MHVEGREGLCDSPTYANMNMIQGISQSYPTNFKIYHLINNYDK